MTQSPSKQQVQSPQKPNNTIMMNVNLNSPKQVLVPQNVQYAGAYNPGLSSTVPRGQSQKQALISNHLLMSPQPKG